MTGDKLLLIVLAAASLAFAVPTANAQATRTWVSGVGDDANPCSRTAPCKTFAGAISKTAAGGEINALDPGGFGAVTITKAITIDGGGGQVASVLVAGTNGIVVSAPATAIVTLRNLRINGLAGTPTGGLNGVQFLSGLALHIENCTIFGFTQNGININLNTAAGIGVFVTDTIVSNSGAGGIAARNAGAGKVFVSMQRVDPHSKRHRRESGWLGGRTDRRRCVRQFHRGKCNGGVVSRRHGRSGRSGHAVVDHEQRDWRGIDRGHCLHLVFQHFDLRQPHGSFVSHRRQSPDLQEQQL